MKSLYRSMGPFVLGFGLLGVLGCSEDNEKEFMKGKDVSSSPASGGSSAPVTYEDYGKQSLSSRPSDYPGVAKAPGATPKSETPAPEKKAAGTSK